LADDPLHATMSMNGEDLFVDTNILVYAHDRDAGAKHETASERVAELWRGEQSPSISVQVLQELYVNVVRKGVSDDIARELVNDYMTWRVINNTAALLTSAIECRELWQLSLWDGLIIAAAQAAGATTLWSEDLNAGQRYGNVIVVNPLRPSP
jgi:predicted nucleic acid-binding protein